MKLRGFSRVDLIAVVVVLVLVGCFVAMIPAVNRARHGADQLKCKTQLRNIISGVHQWTAATDEPWPLVPIGRREGAWEHNTTKGLYELLTFAQLITPELLVSPTERARHVGPGKRFVSSYAHLQPSEARVPWYESYSSTQALFSTRFPEVRGIESRDESGAVTPVVNEDSYAFRMFGVAGRWAGNIAYADGHVSFASRWLDGGRTGSTDLTMYMAEDGSEYLDLPFYDEPDDAAGVNQFLGIFTKAGRERGEFVAVWD